ncbi:MAG TPA: hypothetical protein VHN39_11185 [Phenylobacterium sp.]|nr:hypothetical protein [Phenylobacterium sp.]
MTLTRWIVALAVAGLMMAMALAGAAHACGTAGDRVAAMTTIRDVK